MISAQFRKDTSTHVKRTFICWINCFTLFALKEKNRQVSPPLEHKPSDITRQTSHIRHRTSEIRHQLKSDIGHRTSDISHQKSDIGHQIRTSDIAKQTSQITHRTSHIRHKTSDSGYRTSEIRHQTSDTEHRTSDIRRMTSNVVKTKKWHTSRRRVSHWCFLCHISCSLGILKLSRTLSFLYFSTLQIAPDKCFWSLSFAQSEIISQTFSKPRTMWSKIKKTSFPWRHPCICAVIDHLQRPITAHVAFTSLYYSF